MADAYHLPMAPPPGGGKFLCTYAAARPTATWWNTCPTLNLNNTGYVLNPVLPKDGKFTPTEDAGHGVLFDWAALEKVRNRLKKSLPSPYGRGAGGEGLSQPPSVQHHRHRRCQV